MKKMNKSAQMSANGGGSYKVYECRGCGYWKLIKSCFTVAGRCPNCACLSWRKRTIYY